MSHIIGWAVTAADLGYILKLPALHSACFYFIKFWYYEVKGNKYSSIFVISNIPGYSRADGVSCLANLYFGGRALESI